MPTYAYVYRDEGGTTNKGTSEAENEAMLRKRLTEQGFEVLEIKQTKSQKKGGASRSAKIKLVELSVFCRQFSTMIDAGVSLVRCLAVLQEQTANPKFRRMLGEIQSEVEAGQSLSRALSRFPNTFSNLFLGLVNAGEVGGVLEESMQRLSQFLEKDQELRRKVKSAMTYPIIVMVVAVVIVLGLVTFILPQFMKLFVELDVKEFPLTTTLLMNFSHFLTSKWYIMIGGLAVFIVAFRAFTRTDVGRRAYDRFKLKAPVFGNLNHKIALSRFSRTLGTLLASGVPILSAMETVAGTVANEIISEAILTARARIREGDRIGDPLQKSKLFPPMVVQMISIGEEAGALDAMLGKVADFYEAEVDAALDSLTAAIEPVLIVFLGFAVGFIVISIFMPLVSVVTTLSGGDSGGGGGGE